MARSQNGWIANRRSLIATYTVPGTSVRLPVRKGPVHVVLLYVAARYNREVEKLHPGWNWGYAERTIRGSSTTLSNHASGTAIDLNAPAHPIGTSPWANYSGGQIAAIHRIIRDCDGVVRWGGDYSGRKDGMHFEINAGLAGVRRLARKIGEPDMDLKDKVKLLGWIVRAHPGNKGIQDGKISVNNAMAATYGYSYGAYQAVTGMRAEVRAQAAAIDKLADALHADPVDIAALKKAIHQGIVDAVNSVDVQVTAGEE